MIPNTGRSTVSGMDQARNEFRQNSEGNTRWGMWLVYPRAHNSCLSDTMVFIQGEAYSFELTHITQLPGKGAFSYMSPDYFKQLGGNNPTVTSSTHLWIKQPVT